MRDARRIFFFIISATREKQAHHTKGVVVQIVGIKRLGFQGSFIRRGEA